MNYRIYNIYEKLDYLKFSDFKPIEINLNDI